MRQEFDDDDSSFENNDYDLGDNVMVESELQDDYSVKDADEANSFTGKIARAQVQ